MLKPETLAMMDKAKEPYLNHQAEVEALVVELHKAHEYVKGVPSNSISAKQWEILINTDFRASFNRHINIRFSV